jgi:hypothetical protein
MGGTLDFLVIGAQRSGTTSLWRHLQSHPQLFLPSSKEAPFFSHAEQLGRGLDWYLGEFFPDAPAEALWGTASPHYMMGSPDADVSMIAARIHALLPDVKLIAVLRDPISRAQSHHRMVSHRGRETRTFEQAALDLLDPTALEAARREPPVVQPYVVQGEYGRILGSYLELFPRERLHVLLTEQLGGDSERALGAIFSFLGVDASHRPPQGSRRHHRGGFGKRLDPSAEHELKAYLAREVWPHAAQPTQQRRAFDFWFLQWNVLPDEHSLAPVGAEVRALLEDHYASDAETLEALLGMRVPWSRGT